MVEIPPMASHLWPKLLLARQMIDAWPRVWSRFRGPVATATWTARQHFKKLHVELLPQLDAAVVQLAGDLADRVGGRTLVCVVASSAAQPEDHVAGPPRSWTSFYY